MFVNIVFMGTPDFSVPILRQLIKANYQVSLVVTQPDRPKGRKGVLTPPPVKTEALQHDIPVFQPIKLSESYQEILAVEPDLIITAAYGQLLPKAILDTPPLGCINVHASLLPELRGGAPIHYSILQGKKETGITIMNMAEKLDAGDILTQESIVIEHEDNVGTLHDKLSQVGAKLLLETLPKLIAGELTPIKQDDSKATFAPNITREQEKIDWNQSNLEIYNQIRGLNPWPVAFTTYEKKGMKIWAAELADEHYEQAPGEIIQVDETGFVVVCGNKKGIRITEIQPAGKRRMLVADYLRGSMDRLKKGSILGE